MRVDFRVTQPPRTTGAEQFDRRISELTATLRRVVFTTICNARSLSAQAATDRTVDR